MKICLCLGWEAWAKEEHFEVSGSMLTQNIPQVMALTHMMVQMEIIKKCGWILSIWDFCKKRWLYRYWAKHMGKKNILM